MEQLLKTKKSDPLLRIEVVCAEIFEVQSFQLEDLESFERIFLWWYSPGTSERAGAEERKVSLLETAAVHHAAYIKDGDVPDFFARIPNAYALQQNFLYVADAFSSEHALDEIEKRIDKFREIGRYDPALWREVFIECLGKFPENYDSEKDWDRLLNIGLPFLRERLARWTWKRLSDDIVLFIKKQLGRCTKGGA